MDFQVASDPAGNVLRLTLIDSSDIRALLKASERIGGKLVLLSPGPSVAKIFDIVRVDTLPGLEVRSQEGILR